MLLQREICFLAVLTLQAIPQLTLDKSKLTTAQNMFASCRAVAKITINGSDVIDLPSLSDMSYIFYGCKLLASDNYSDNKFPNPPTGNASTVRQMYTQCTSIKEFRNNFDLSNATNIQSLFNGCNALTTLPTITWNTTSDYLADSLYNGCSSVTDWSAYPDFSRATSMNSTYYNSNVPVIPTSSGNPIDTRRCINLSACFMNCFRLTTYPFNDTSATTNVSRMFYNSTQLGTAGTVPSQSNPMSFPNATTGFEAFLNNYRLIECPWSKGSFDKVTTTYTGNRYTGLGGLHRNNIRMTTYPADMFDVATTNWYYDTFNNCALTAGSIDNIVQSILKARPDSSIVQDGTLTLTNNGVKISDLSATSQNLIATRVASDGWTVTLDTTRSAGDVFRYVPIPSGFYRDNGSPQYVWHGVYNLNEIITNKPKTAAPGISFEDFKLFRQQEWFPTCS